MTRFAPLALALFGGASLVGSFIGCGDSEETLLPPSATSGPGSGGGGGGPEPCQSPADCATPNACVRATCQAGVCGLDPLPADTPLGTQSAEDCKRMVCDGNGGVQTINDDTDLPNDNNDCTTDSCTNGIPANDPVLAGTMCATGVCSEAGVCVACNTFDDCPGTDDECQQRTCDANVCGVEYTAAQTKVASQTNGDCHINVCDGQGTIINVVDNGDVPVDFNDCTDDVCTNGLPTNPNMMQGQPCGVGLFCDGNGGCVGCVTPDDCSGVDDECKTKTCTNGTCGFDFTPPNTPVSLQNPGDCLSLVCDGGGGIVTIAENNDLPVDGNQCTSDSCQNGVPSNPPVQAGTSCMQNGGTVCSVNGQCVQCNLAADCPAPGQPCKVATCSMNMCGIGNAQMGTVCGAPSCAGGLQQNVDTCDNGGNCVDGGSIPCTPYICGMTACNTSCLNDTGCAGGYSCDTGLAACTNGPKCTDYCNAIQANCTGANQQYTTQQSCLQSCNPLPRGTAADTGGNTVGCRIYHAGAALSAPSVHCTHAGPGGDGVCGTNCTSFCIIAEGVCTGANDQYTSQAQCETECAGFPIAPPYNTGVTSGDSLACRLYHLTQAAIQPVPHCTHIPEGSSTCQ